MAISRTAKKIGFINDHLGRLLHADSFFCLIVRASCIAASTAESPRPLAGTSSKKIFSMIQLP
jgi:hypothetical protein